MAESLTIPAADGFPLAASLYPAHEDSAAPVTVIISSATAVPRGYYDAYAQHLAERGLRVVTYDYRGIGDSRPASLRGFRASMRDWAERDMAGVIAFAKRDLASRRVLFVGHSSGGHMMGLAPNNADLHAALFIASQSCYWRLWPAPRRYQMALYFHALIPGVAHALGYIPGKLGMGQDLPRDVALQWAAWGRRPNYLVEGDAERAAFSRFRGQLVAYSISDDHYAPEATVDALLRFYIGAERSRRYVDAAQLHTPIGHFGFFRTRMRELLWSETSDWLLERA